MEQGTDRWHEWRHRGIGSSDAAAVMERSPYLTPLQLWKRKVGPITAESRTNFAMERGTQLEPIARADYEIHNDIDMHPSLVEMEQFPFMRASLDGRSPDGRRILEIKCPGKTNHELAKQGRVPDHYWIQIQHQLLISQADACDYFSFDGERGVKIEVIPDRTFHGLLLSRCIHFWYEHVSKKIPPPAIEQDYKKLMTKGAKALAIQIREAEKVLEKARAELSYREADLLDLAEGKDFVKIEGLYIRDGAIRRQA